MTRIALLATAAVIALATPAAAGWMNAFTSNGINPNALNANAVNPNALTANAVIAHSPPSEFCAQGKGEAAIAHSPPSEFCAIVAQPSGLSLGGTDGMKVMSIELPR